RKEVADRLAQLGPGLQDTNAGDLQRQVVLVRGLDQSVEHRVVQAPPPVRVRRVERLRRGGGARQVGRRDVALRRLVVRTDQTGGGRREREGERRNGPALPHVFPAPAKPHVPPEGGGILYRGVGLPGLFVITRPEHGQVVGPSRP